MTWPAALLVAAGLAAAGRGLGWLTASGAAAATGVAAPVLAAGGLPAFALLASFFVSGSLLSYASGHAAEDRGPPSGPRRGGDRPGRDARQVLANGLWAAGAALLLPRHPAFGWAALTGTLAAAQADTWATEIGLRRGGIPRLITTGRPVAPGTSGAVTPQGTAGGLMGAAAMGAVALAVGGPVGAVAAGVVGGLAGLTADSLLGATVQTRYRCDACGSASERRRHGCGAAARHVGGPSWPDNDGVNLLATGLGAVVALGLTPLLL